VSCVKNLDKINDLRIHWYIPGPHNRWIPPGEIAPNERPSKQASPGFLLGCLRYGNLTDKTTARFEGSQEDKAAAESDGERQCLAQAQIPPAQKVDIPRPTDPLFGFKTRIRMFLPSSLARPRETMLKLEGETAIEPRSDQTYWSYFTYDVTRYADRPDGDPRDVRIGVEFPGVAEKLVSLIPEIPLAVPLVIQKVSFGVESSSGWRLSSALYRFFDKDNQVITTLQFPVFVPNRSP
jgi:hypothetical protein